MAKETNPFLEEGSFCSKLEDMYRAVQKVADQPVPTSTSTATATSELPPPLELGAPAFRDIYIKLPAAAKWDGKKQNGDYQFRYYSASK